MLLSKKVLTKVQCFFLVNHPFSNQSVNMKRRYSDEELQNKDNQGVLYPPLKRRKLEVNELDVNQHISGSKQHGHCNRDKHKGPLCRYWVKAECKFGLSCRNRHGYNTDEERSDNNITYFDDDNNEHNRNHNRYW